MSLITRNPFALMTELQRDMNRIFDNRLFPTLGNGQHSTLSNTDWIPVVDIHEDADGYHVSVDLPGVKPDDIEVTAHNNVLSIRGSRTEVSADKEQKRSERVYGTFLREFTMPDNADLDRIDAKSKNGVLDIFVPKAPKPEPKRITVQ
jgi:HSP20 family protein